jgi:dihydrolipoamide dehydrogenase
MKMGRNRFDYDLIVVGSGSAGSAAALMAAGAGLKTAVIEAKKWGGSALNYGDVPFGALFTAAHLYHEAVRGARFGLSSAGLRYNYPTMAHFKEVAMRRAGANSKKIFEEAGVTCIHGRAQFLSPYEVGVGTARVSAAKFLIATGAEMIDSGIKGLETVPFLMPAEVLDLVRPPKTIFVVGAGSTGCEIAQYFAELGSKVLIADIAGRLLPREDEEVGQEMDLVFNEKLGIKVLTQSRVVAIERDALSKKVIFMRGGQEKSVRIDEIVIATGSAPAMDLGLENAGVKYARGGIGVDKTLMTTSKHIWAAGDAIGGESSTERAAYQARVAVVNIAHKSRVEVDYAGFMRVTDTWPAVATVGKTEDDCIRHDRKIRKVIVPLSVAMASNTQDFREGFVKIITDRSDKIIGATVVAPEAAIIAQELAMSVKMGLTPRELSDVPHAAGAWGEVIRIAAKRLVR